MAKKIIALSPLWDEEKDGIRMRRTYLDAIRESGAIPLVLPIELSREDAEQILSQCDGLLLTGGPDLHPELYGEEVDPACGTICLARDKVEKTLFEVAMDRDMAILGICRGIQTINVCLGGSLYQDLPTQLPSDLTHNGEPPYDRVLHYVTLEGPLKDLLGTERLGVNSFHHQAVKELGQGLEIMARAEDGVIEAVRHTGKRFLWGLQWHPEFSFYADENSRILMKTFVEACG